MGYAVYDQGTRWAGYGVPAECDHPDCTTAIHRGLDYRCDEWIEWKYFLEGVEVSGDGDWDNEVEIERDDGCGFFFCEQHSDHPGHSQVKVMGKPDSAEWVAHILTDESWAQWRRENPSRLNALTQG